MTTRRQEMMYTSTDEDVRAARPDALIDRLALYLSMIAGSHEIDRRALVHAAYLDEIMTPWSPDETFERTPFEPCPIDGVKSQRIQDEIDTMLITGLIRKGERRTEWIEAINPPWQTRWEDDHRALLENSTWAAHLEYGFRGFTESGNLNRDDHAVFGHANWGRDLHTVIMADPQRKLWIERGGEVRDMARYVTACYVRFREIIAEDEKIRHRKDRQIALPMWFYTRLLVTQAMKTVDDYNDFGDRRYLRVYRHMRYRWIENYTTVTLMFFDAEDTATEQEEFVGRIVMDKTGPDTLMVTDFEVVSALQRRGYGQVMMRQLQSIPMKSTSSREYRITVSGRLGKKLRPLLYRHGIKRPDGNYELERVSWPSVTLWQ